MHRRIRMSVEDQVDQRLVVGPLLIDILVTVTLYHHLFDVQPPQPSRSSKFHSLTMEKGTYRMLRSPFVWNPENITFPFNKHTHIQVPQEPVSPPSSLLTNRIVKTIPP